MKEIEKIAREAIELAEKATPGPWLGIISNDRNGACFGCGPKHNLCYQDCYDTSDDCSDALSAHDDAALIAHAGTHYKELAQAVLDLSAQNARMQDLLVRIRDEYPMNEAKEARILLASLKESHDKA